jgi:hypothetical protein
MNICNHESSQTRNLVLSESFLASKMPKNSPTCICKFGIFPELYPCTPVKMGRGETGRKGEGEGREREVECLAIFRFVVPPLLLPFCRYRGAGGLQPPRNVGWGPHDRGVDRGIEGPHWNTVLHNIR